MQELTPLGNNTYICYILKVFMGLDDGLPEPEHTHEDGTIHAHIGGDEPHTHDEKIYKGIEKKSQDVCTCDPPERSRMCVQHGG